MPKGEKFVNPYRFVKPVKPDEQTIKRLKEKVTHEKFHGYSGTIHADLLTLTPIVIGGRKEPRYVPENPDQRDIEKSFMHNPENNEPLIPGSTLKGSIVTIYKILTGNNKNCEIIFGNMNRNRNELNFKGNIHFTDAQLDCEHSNRRAHDIKKLKEIKTVLGPPRDRHKAFYKDNNQIKLYHHQSYVTKVDQLHRRASANMTTVIVPISPDCVFSFKINFYNLNKTQLQYLLSSLFLDQGLCHKIGGGKPLGAGSVNISLDKIKICPDKKEFYKGRGKIECFDNILDTLHYFAFDLIEIPDDTFEMLLWRPYDDNEYSYPNRYWFKDRSKRNSRTPLKSIDEVFPDTDDEVVDDAINDIDARWKKCFTD